MSEAIHPLRFNGGYSKGDPPLPIPNREVKPFHADGTAPKRWESRSLPVFTTMPCSANYGAFFFGIPSCFLTSLYTSLFIFVFRKTFRQNLPWFSGIMGSIPCPSIVAVPQGEILKFTFYENQNSVSPFALPLPSHELHHAHAHSPQSQGRHLVRCRGLLQISTGPVYPERLPQTRCR